MATSDMVESLQVAACEAAARARVANDKLMRARGASNESAAHAAYMAAAKAYREAERTYGTAMDALYAAGEP